MNDNDEPDDGLAIAALVMFGVVLTILVLARLAWMVFA